MDPSTTKQDPVNFLHVGEKVLDWRYQTVSQLYPVLYKGKEKMIHWIGTIDLEAYRNSKSKNRCEILFADSLCHLTTDAELARNESGASKEVYTPYVYAIGLEISNELKLASSEKELYFNVFLEEKTSFDGAHHVSLLYNENYGKYKYGIPTIMPWCQMPVSDWIRYNSISIEEIKRTRILTQEPYKWLK